MQTPKLHIKFCRLVKRAMFICTGFPQLDTKSARHLAELLKGSRAQTMRDNTTKFCLSCSVNETGCEQDTQDVGPTPNDWYSQELAEYASSVPTRDNMKSVLLFVAFNLLTVAKYAYHVILTWLELDYHDFEQNIKPIAFNGNGSSGDGSRQQVFRFLCVLTNCTRLSRGSHEDLHSYGREGVHYTAAINENPVHRLAADLKHVPIFTLCHPNLLFLFSPMAELGQLGILTYCYLSLFIVCTSLGFTVQQIFNRANAESLMFIVAPHVTMQLLCIQLEKMRREYTSSLELFRALANANNVDGHSMTNLPTLVGSGGGGTQSLVSLRDVERGPIRYAGNLRHRFHQYRLLFEEHKVQHPDEAPGNSSSQEFISDCLPAVRSGWWHKRIAYLYFNSFFWFVWIFCLPTAFLAFSVIQYTLHNMQVRLEAFDKFIEAEGCAIWYERGATIKLAHLNVGWSLWDIFESGPPVVWAVYIVIIMSTLIFAIMLELICWLKEIRQNLQLLRELVHLQNSGVFLQEHYFRDLHMRAPSPQVPAGIEKSGMSIMRDLFMRHTHIRGFFIKTTPLSGDYSGKLNYNKARASDLRVKLAQQEFALAMLQQADSTRLLLVEVAEKIYLNHRLFVRLVDMYSTNIAATILLEHIAAYGSTLMAVVLAKITSDVSQYARTLIVITLTCVFTFIGLISNFHAEARKLQPLFWSLIAELANTRDLDLLHLRHVLIKHTVHIDREGGLAMCAFNFRVTYTNVIQVIVWTSTILVLTFR